MTLPAYPTAILARCRPANGEDGFCLGCKVYAPAGEDEILCPACQYKQRPMPPRTDLIPEPSDVPAF